MNLMEEAKKYVDNGMLVFPLKNNSKSKQLVASWKTEATDQFEKIEEWWNQFPNANIGIQTGNGLIVIDIDNKNSHKGNQSIGPFFKSFPATRIVQTPNHGFHIYYHVNKEIRCRVNLYDGIDIRGEGGYVLAPPSVVDGKQYQIYHNHPIADANEAVYEFLNVTKKETINLIDEFIPIGCRNDTLFKLGCSLQAKGLLNESITEALKKENELHCESPLSEKELYLILEGIQKRYKKGSLNIQTSEQTDEYFNAAELVTHEYEDEHEIVKAFIPIGVTLLGAPQKIGKTFFALQLSNCVANGSDFLGKEVEQGNVLYFALEDSKSKINKRLKNYGIPISKNLNFKCIKPYDENFNMEKEIERELSIHPNLKMIVVDTFPKIRKEAKVDYQCEYEEVTLYHELAMKYEIAIVLILHLRKTIDRNNPFDNIYGSRGVTAATDGMIVMLRHELMPKYKELFHVGKDIPEGSFILKQEDNLLFTIADDIEEERTLDDNLIRLIHYIVSKKEFSGTHQELCSHANLSIEARGLSSLIRGHSQELEDNFIEVDYPPRTSKARIIHLRYIGNDDISEDIA